MLKFVETITDPYTGQILIVTEKSEPITHRHARIERPPSIPVAIPPNPPLPQLDYIYKRFTIDCDADVKARDLREGLEDNDYLNPDNLPQIKTGVQPQGGVQLSARVNVIDTESNGLVAYAAQIEAERAKEQAARDAEMQARIDAALQASIDAALVARGLK